MRGGFAVAGQAEGAEVIEVALAAALSYGTDVVGIPEGAAGGDGLHPVQAEAGDAGGAAGAFKGVVDGEGVGLTGGADAAVAGEDLITEVAGVGAQTPLVDTVVGTEGAAALGKNLELAPTAERQIVRSAREGVLLGATAGEGTSGEHRGSGDWLQSSKSVSSGSIRGKSQLRSCWWTGCALYASKVARSVNFIMPPNS